MKMTRKIAFTLLGSLIHVIGVLGQIPCLVSNTATEPNVGCTQGPWVLVFDDEFTGDAIDLSKWLTCDTSNKLDRMQCHGGTSSNAIDYDNGKNFVFNHPGVSLVDRNVPVFQAKAFEYDTTTKVEKDGIQNYRNWAWTSSNLYSGYTFPSKTQQNGSNSGLNGIYVLTCILPQSPNPYAGGSNPYGMIWPAFWMWNGVGSDYGELDGFEFSGDAYTDYQTSHAPTVANVCPLICDPGSTNFGNGQPHAHTLIYTPNEIDWYVDVTLTRSDFKNYYNPLPGLGTIYAPFTCKDDTMSSSGVPFYTNNIFPDIPMWLYVNDAVQHNANAANFPVYMKIISVKYYESLPCTGNPVIVPSMVENDSNSTNFNVYSGANVFLNCGTTPDPNHPGINDAGMLVPLHKHQWATPYLGQLEVIAQNKVVIMGGFKESGYFVAKTDNNLCNEYGGSLPTTGQQNHTPIKSLLHDSSQINGLEPGTISFIVKNSLTTGQFSIALSNIDETELNQNAVVTVYNTLGQNIYQNNMLIQSGNELMIDLSGKARGLYLITLQTNDKVLRGKVILQ